VVARYKSKLKLVGPEQLTEAPVVSAEEVTAAAAAQAKAAQEELKLVELAKLDTIAYDRVREEAAKELGCRVTTLDDAVAKRRPHTEAVGKVNVAIGHVLAATPANLPTRPATAQPQLPIEALPDNV
jgi:hypothetical protein